MTINSKIGNLGDNLWLTPFFKHGIAKKIILPDDKVCRNVAKIFDGLGDIEFSNLDYDHCPETNDRIHRSAAHLKYFNCNKSPIPYIIIKDEELEFAQNIVKGIQNPIAVNFTTSNKGGDLASSLRCFNYEQIKLLVKHLIDFGYTPINFGLSHNTDNIDGVIKILDLDIRNMAACYKLIGKYIGSESGPPHLMLAVGGKILVYHPNSDDLYYPSWKYHFTDEYWENEQCRAKYINFSNINPINDLTFFK
jgi:hypothetical protein